MPEYPDITNISIADIIRSKPDASAAEILKTYALVEGVKLGAKLKRDLATEVISEIPIEINVTLNDFSYITDQIPPLLLKAKLTLNSCEFAYASNSAVLVASIYSGGTSYVNIFSTTNLTARFLYALSVLFSTTAMGASGSAVIAKRCQINSLGICTEAAGLAFLQLGNQARLMARQAEGKLILKKPRRPLSFLKGNKHNAGFIMPGDNLNTDLLSQKVLTVLAITFTLYGYGKFLIKSYKYGQKLCRKISQKRRSSLRKKRSILIRKQVTFLILCFSLSKRKTKYYSKSNFSLFGT